MQIVIDIPEDDYHDILQYTELKANTEFENLMIVAIKNGTTLPKGHGRLIDADKFEKRLMDARSYYIGEKTDDFDLRFAAGLKSAAERLVDAPTIVEAEENNNE